jgi:hypothetical protein
MAVCCTSGIYLRRKIPATDGKELEAVPSEQSLCAETVTDYRKRKETKLKIKKGILRGK